MKFTKDHVILIGWKEDKQRVWRINIYSVSRPVQFQGNTLILVSVTATAI
jgi:hypothetical protein